MPIEKLSNEKLSNNLILKKADIVLIKHSEEVKNTEIYGNLYECLKSYTTLSPKNLKQDIVFDDKARMILTHNVKTMMERVKDEWYAKTSYLIATTEVHCQLCGAKNKYICYITNRLNGVELHVGTECIKNYKDINGADIALKQLRANQRDTKKEARISDFDTALGDNIKFTKISSDRIETFPILLPYKLYTELKNIITDCNRIRTSYINTGSNLEECIKKYNIKITQFENLFKQAESFYEQNKNNPLICTREIADWLKIHNPNIITEIQKSKSILNENTLQYIHEPNFVRKNLPIFRKCIKDNDVKFISVKGNVIRFVIKNQRFVQPIYFTMPLDTFMKNIGCHCLAQSGYKFSKLNLYPSIENTSSNLNSVINYFIGILNSMGYTIITEERTSQLYWEKKQNITINKWSKHARVTNPIYKIVTPEKLFSIMSNVLLDDKPEKEIAKNIVSKIEMSGKWITKEDKNRDVQIASEAAGMRKQKEFTAYV